MAEYISGEHLTDDDVEAHDRGELVAWRRGIDGVMWYKRVQAPASPPEILGVPSVGEAACGDDWPGADYPRNDYPTTDAPDDADYPEAGYPAIRSEEDDDE